MDVWLWRADSLPGVLVFDQSLTITKADRATAIIFGIPAESMTRQPLGRFLSLSPGFMLNDFFGTHKGASKKGSAWVVGPLHEMAAFHSDGAQFHLTVQAVRKPGAPLITARVKMNKPPVGGAALGGLHVGGIHAPPQVLGNSHPVTTRAKQHLAAGRTGMAAEGAPPRQVTVLLSDLSGSESTDDDGSPDGMGEHMVRGEMEGQDVRSNLSPDQVTDLPTEKQEEDASEYSDVSDGQDLRDGELSVDYRRAKRLKRLIRIYGSRWSQSSTMNFHIYSTGVLLVLLIAHIVAYLILAKQVTRQYQYLISVADMAKAADAGQLIVLKAVILQKCGLQEYKDANLCSNTSLAGFVNTLPVNIRDLHSYHQRLYLGPGGKPRRIEDPRLYSVWTDLTYPEIIAEGSRPPPSQPRLTGLWSLGNQLVVTGGELLYFYPIMGARLNATLSFQYISRNGPASFYEAYATSLGLQASHALESLGSWSAFVKSLMAVEVALVLLPGLMYQLAICLKAGSEHLMHFFVFFSLPSAVLRRMATMNIKVEDDDDLDEEDDLVADQLGQEGGAQPPANKERKQVTMAADVGIPATKVKPAGIAPASGVNGPAAPKDVMHKTPFDWLGAELLGLVSTTRTRRVYGKMVTPAHNLAADYIVVLALWVLAVVILYVLALTRLKQLSSPVASLHTVARLMYMLSKVRLDANFVVFAPNATEKALTKAVLLKSTQYFASEYHTLLYGGTSLELRENPDRAFEGEAPVSIFTSRAVTELFYTTTQCLCRQASKCHQPSSPYYKVTHLGLDAMIQRFVQEMFMMTQDPDPETGPASIRYDYIRKVVANDMYDGILAAVNLFRDSAIAQYDAIREMHLGLLIATVIIFTVMILMTLFRRTLKQSRKDCHLLAGLLSLIPPEIDVEKELKRTIVERSVG